MCKQKAGMVYLVGAGPGDPGLLTLRGKECLNQAEVVIHDRLVNRSILAHARGAEWIDVGKHPNHHPIPQARINEILVEQASSGKIVVRLKGGDPFVFGRGGEEALALVQAGIPFQIVPGVTSAVAVPAYAGIPITQRGMACSAALITGHRADCIDDPKSDWLRVARGADTLVFLMGVKNLGLIVEQVLAAGRSPDTAVALIEQGTCLTQKTVAGTLENILDLAAEIEPPSIIVIGEVVRLHESLSWFEPFNSTSANGRYAQEPLIGKCVLNTLPLLDSQQDALNGQLRRMGAEPIDLPTFQILPPEDMAPLDRALLRFAKDPKNQKRYDWLIFTSNHAVGFTIDRLLKLGSDLRAFNRMKPWAVGEAAVEKLNAFGLKADRVSGMIDPKGLSHGAEDLTGLRMALFHSNLPDLELAAALQDLGAIVEPILTYRFSPLISGGFTETRLLESCVNVATFLNPFAVHGLEGMIDGRSLPDLLAPLTVACAGPGTADTARALGVRIDIETEERSVGGMCEALRIHFQDEKIGVKV